MRYMACKLSFNNWTITTFSFITFLFTVSIFLSSDRDEKAVVDGCVSMYEVQISLLKSNIKSLKNQYEIEIESLKNIKNETEVFPPKKKNVRERLLEGHYDDKTVVLHVVSHTHWDREWYLPFEKFRRALVQITDDIWELLKKDKNFYHWHNDGQMSIIEDYLEIRPQMLNHVTEAAKKNFFSLGPWYTQPDEFLVSGESLIRNLMLGIKLAKKYGYPSMVGYLPDTFGHISQLPQILLGFGIETAIIGRGVRHTGDGFPSETFWKSPDGSTVFVVYLASWYCNALFHHRMSSDHNDSQIMSWFELKYRKILKDHSKINHALLLNGCDHTGVDYDVGDVVYRGDQLMSQNHNIRVVHSNIDEFAEMAREEVLSAQKKGVKFVEYNGELYTGQDVEMDLVNVISNQIHQKQANWRAQTNLEKYSEPITTINWLLFGEDYDQDMFTYAWKLLLQNHAHDSIAGCSSDETHRDVDNRMARTMQVSESLFTESITKMMRYIDIGNNFTYPQIIVINPLSNNATSLVVVKLDFPMLTTSNLALYDYKGDIVPSSILLTSTDFEEWDFVLPNKGFRKGYRPGKRIQILFQAKDIPALGYSIYSVNGTAPKPPEPPTEKDENPVISNEYWDVIIHDNGEVTMKSKINGIEIKRLNTLNLCLDSGSEYITMSMFCEQPDKRNQNFQILPPKIVRTSFYESASVTIVFKPRAMSINVGYLLGKMENQLQVRVALKNDQENHRIQAGFDISHNAHVILDSQFNMLNISLVSPIFHSQQNFVAVHNSVLNRGFMIANRGIPEVDLTWDKKLSITLLRSVSSLGDWGVFGVETALEKGYHAFEYSIIPYFGIYQSEDVNLLPFMNAIILARAFNAPLVGIQVLDYETRGPLSSPLLDLEKSTLHHLFNTIIFNYNKGGGVNENDGSAWYPKPGRLNLLPSRYSFIDLKPEYLVLSALKKSETRDSIIIRCYNPTNQNFTGSVSVCNKKFSKAFYCNLNEDRKTEILAPYFNGIVVQFDAPFKKIITLELEL